MQNVSSTVHAGCRKSSANLADKVQLLLTRLSDLDEDFVRSVCINVHRSPTIVQSTQIQIEDLQLFYRLHYASMKAITSIKLVSVMDGRVTTVCVLVCMSM